MGNSFIGVSNLSRKIKNIYIGVNGVARQINNAYIGVNGVARPIFSVNNGTIYDYGSGLTFTGLNTLSQVFSTYLYTAQYYGKNYGYWKSSKCTDLKSLDEFTEFYVKGDDKTGDYGFFGFCFVFYDSSTGKDVYVNWNGKTSFTSEYERLYLGRDGYGIITLNDNLKTNYKIFYNLYGAPYVLITSYSNYSYSENNGDRYSIHEVYIYQMIFR